MSEANTTKGIAMNLKEMRNKVLQELEQIEKTPRPQQSDLRMVYFTSRMHSLGKKAKGEKSAADVLRECIEFLRKDNPNVEFRYNQAFFAGMPTRPRKPSKKGK
jgi:hypothetical protein